MTKILKMEMKGFKSFANKTEVVFGDNFDCILGPNGSGKSNVLDALCFVLGKAGAKGLRVEKSSNLIYNGGKTKKPAKQGEVSIWFTNDENEFTSISTKEIKITRVIKHNGQGIYKINDETTTRTKIIDLLSQANINPDGYNIILQGDIVRLIEMSPNERREIIEEIAGIDVYEDKKQKALRELDRVETKLNEADIVLAEREAYLKDLKKDRDKAQKYKTLEERRQRNKKTLLTQQRQKKLSHQEQLYQQLTKHSSQIETLQEKITKHQTTIAQKKEKIRAINKEIEEKGEKEQVEIHKKVEELKVAVALDQQRLTTISDEIDKLISRKKELESSHHEIKDKTSVLHQRQKEIDKQIRSREVDKGQVEEKIIAFKKKNNLDEESSVDEKIDNIDAKIEQLQSEMNGLREQQQQTFRQKDKVEIALENIDEKLAKLASVKDEHKKELDKLQHKKKEFKTTTLELNKALSQSSQYASQLSNARTKLLSQKEELSSLQGKQAAVLEQLAGGSALKAVLEMKEKNPEIHGTVAQLGNVEQKFSQALEIAAGGKIKSVVTQTDKTAAQCISQLKERRLGVATFLPMNKIRTSGVSQELRNISGPGVYGLALDLISFDATYKKVFEYVFGNTLVVDTIETARKIGVGKVRMVTLTGDIVETSGAMQGGFRKKKQGGGLFGQEEVSKKIQQLTGEIADSQTVISRLEHQSSENEELINRLRSLKAELEGEIIKVEKSLHLDSDDALLDTNKKKDLRKENEELETQVENIQEKISEKNKEFAQLKIQRQQLRDEISALRNPAKLAELKTLEEKKAELTQQIIQLQGESKHTSSELETIVGPEDRRILDILKQHQKELDSFKKEQKELENALENKQKELDHNQQLQKKFMEQFKESFAQRSTLEKQVSTTEHQIADYTAKQRGEEQKVNALNLEKAKLQAEIAALEEELKQFADVDVYENKSVDVMKRELSQFEKMAQDLGAVNMRALEIYEQVASEYAQLQEKKDVLRKEREDVLVMINEIDSKKKELFMKTFDALQENFKRIFKTLLSKGEAEIVLENEQDPFTGGVVIKVRLSGKRFMDIRSLSGGEKTMTALSFLFAVQEYEPASFYILDEVDAALDKRNSERLAELIRSYCEKAQYIVISHNDGVISEADNLYGVSMNEHGMSKITTLKI